MNYPYYTSYSDYYNDKYREEQRLREQQRHEEERQRLNQEEDRRRNMFNEELQRMQRDANTSSRQINQSDGKSNSHIASNSYMELCNPYVNLVITQLQTNMCEHNTKPGENNLELNTSQWSMLQADGYNLCWSLLEMWLNITKNAFG